MSINNDGYCDITGFKCNEPHGGYMNDSLIYNYNFYNHLNKKRENNTAERLDFKNLKTTMTALKEYENNYECIKSRYNDDCTFVGKSQEDLMEHEKICLKITHTRPLVEPSFISCDSCGKKFHDKGQKFKPIYALNAHKKTCKANLDRNRLKYIKSVLSECDSEKIKKIYFYLQSIENND